MPRAKQFMDLGTPLPLMLAYAFSEVARIIPSPRLTPTTTRDQRSAAGRKTLRVPRLR